MKKILVIALLISLVFPNTSNAIENGEIIKSDPNAVGVGFDNHGGCGGFMISPRILLTAAHCTYGVTLPNYETYKLKDTEVYVFPADKLYRDSIKSVKVYRPNNFVWQQTNGAWGYSNDFAAVVLSKSLPFNNNVKIATQDDIKSFIEAKNKATLIGFGFQSSKRNAMAQFPSRASFELIDQTEANLTINEYRNKWGRNGTYNYPVHFKIPKGGITPCDGDSGSPIFVEKEGIRFYIGPVSYMLGSTNCGADKFWGDNGAIQSLYPATQYLDLIQQAEEYIKDNPEKTVKTLSSVTKTITCKNKTSKKNVKVTGLICPKGYSKV
jgi:secreted trypsin-like serine protease